ncbi:MAG: hypothetical protein LBC96_02905 [Lachnospiraceae bacterium]|jgi:hypothetical protein|nr:hypothetical protein [Lachnospiraceae bacterium]
MNENIDALKREREKLKEQTNSLNWKLNRMIPIKNSLELNMGKMKNFKVLSNSWRGLSEKKHDTTTSSLEREYTTYIKRIEDMVSQVKEQISANDIKVNSLTNEINKQEAANLISGTGNVFTY